MLIQSSIAYKSLKPIQPPIDLPNFVVISGINGSGKTQLLEGIGGRMVEIYDDEKRLESIKFIDQHALVPNPTSSISFEQIRQMSVSLFNLYQNYKISKLQHPHIELRTHLGGHNQAGTIEAIALNAGKNVEDLEADDFILNFPAGEIGIGIDNFYHQNFAQIFKRYQARQYLNEFNQFRNQKYGDVAFLSDEEFIRTHGDPPWILVNQILEAAHLGYYITTPEGQHAESTFQPLLINEINDVGINFNDLSSGEKVIMCMALSLYNSHFDIEFPMVLVMDEPDAHLHPSMTKQFLDVIQNVFVDKKGIKVIITTHSPSTVALAPESSLFVMSKTGERISKATKDQALKILTAGVPTLSINYENRRQVFVESKYDVFFYEKIYEKLRETLVPEISINFISSGVGGQGNCDQVKEIVNKLTSYGNKTIYGIIDWDTKNIGNQYVKVLGKEKRYSLENYIFDPILLAAFLVREKYIEIAKLGLITGERYIDFTNFENAKLQRMADFIVNQIRPKAGNPVDTDIQETEYVGGKMIKLPTWFLTIQGHNLENHIKELFPQLNKYRGEGKLKEELINKVIDDIPEFIPKDVASLLSDIQDYQI